LIIYCCHFELKVDRILSYFVRVDDFKICMQTSNDTAFLGNWQMVLLPNKVSHPLFVMGFNEGMVLWNYHIRTSKI
jgi:hypothetical protein